jgi:hypothetical protein
MPQRVRVILIQRLSHRGRKSFPGTRLGIHKIGGGQCYLAKELQYSNAWNWGRIVVRGSRDQARPTQPLRIRVDPPDSSRQVHHG